MTIIPEEHIEEYVEFLDQDYFEARKIIVVADRITPQESGRAHVSSRGVAVGHAYCYEEIKLHPV